MNSVLYDISVTPRSGYRLFRDSLFLYEEGERYPFAFRSPYPALERPSNEGDLIFEYGGFRIIRAGNSLFCSYTSEPRIYALFKPIKGEDTDEKMISSLISMLKRASRLDPHTQPKYSAYTFYEDYIQRTAEFCGVLTDLCKTNDGRIIPFSSDMSRDSAYLAVVLTVIALMFRRISALRGFNFKLVFPDSVACLVFSARIFEKDAEKIPEFDVINKFEKYGRLALISEKKRTDDGLIRFSVAICPQTCDPADVLRTPEILKRSKDILKGIDLYIPGKY